MFLDCFQLGLGKPDFNTNFFKLSVDRPNTTQACEPGICLNNTFSFIPSGAPNEDIVQNHLT